MEAIKKSKVIQAVGNGSWSSEKYGTFYKFEIHFENGDHGEYSSKDQNQSKFIVGQEAEYSITSKDVNGKTFYQIKPQQSQASGGGSFTPKAKDPETEKRITRMSVLKCVTDLVIAKEIKLHDLTKVAQILEHYVISGEDSMQAVYHAHHQKSKKPEGNIEANFREDMINQMANDQEDDLPF